ncbi:uncharacterized protein LOC134542774 [Bacillus rossius redtenbacheri]|uniref:uncharacterized protein LOC134542774 n=1 Tax=Bacillus rossius redtenbacheri TaxID=93214 RepID=UPI002FDD3ACD
MMESHNKPEKHVRFSVSKNASKPVQVQVSGKVHSSRKSLDENVSCRSAVPKINFITKNVKLSTKPKKQLVRSVEESIGSKKVSVVHLPETPKELDFRYVSEDDEVDVQYFKDACKYDKPEFFSTVAIQKKLQVMNQAPISKSSITKIDQPVLIDKAARKLNFWPEERLYRDLVSLAVDEGDAAGSQDKGHRRGKGCLQTRDLEPQLCDFFRPSFRGEYGTPCRPPLTAVDSIRRYDGLSLYRRCRAWRRTD